MKKHQSKKFLEVEFFQFSFKVANFLIILWARADQFLHQHIISFD